MAGRLAHAQLEPLGAGGRGRRGELDQRADHRGHEQPGAIRQRVESARSAGLAGTAASRRSPSAAKTTVTGSSRVARALAPELLRAAAQVVAEQILEAGGGLRRRLDPARRRELVREAHRGYGTGMARIRRRVRAHGKVQGVFFRDSTREEAERREVTGWVKNCADGSVEAVFEGEPDMVEHMVWFVRTGRAARTSRASTSTRKSPRICAASK